MAGDWDWTRDAHSAVALLDRNSEACRGGVFLGLALFVQFVGAKHPFDPFRQVTNDGARAAGRAHVPPGQGSRGAGLSGWWVPLWII